MGVPLWIATDGWQAANRVVVDRALAAGLTFRPLGETVLGALREAEPVDGVGLTPERERDAARALTRNTPRVAEQPAGTVTLLFTDIEGSTRLLDELGRA